METGDQINEPNIGVKLGAYVTRIQIIWLWRPAATWNGAVHQTSVWVWQIQHRCHAGFVSWSTSCKPGRTHWGPLWQMQAWQPCTNGIWILLPCDVLELRFVRAWDSMLRKYCSKSGFYWTFPEHLQLAPIWLTMEDCLYSRWINKGEF